MNVHFIIYIAFAVYFNSFDCHLFSRKHVSRRQTQAMYQNPNQMSQASQISQTSNSKRPVYPNMNPSRDNVIFPPKITNFPPPKADFQAENGGLGSENFGPESSRLLPGKLEQGQIGFGTGNVGQGQVGLSTEKMAPSDIALAPENALLNNVASAIGNVEASNSALSSGNASPKFTGFPSMNNVGLASENVLPNNAGSVTENALPNNVESSPENSQQNNAGLASGNGAASNSELAAGNQSSEFNGFPSMNNVGAVPENALPNNVELSSGNVPSENMVFFTQNAALPSGNFGTSDSVGFSPLPNSHVSMDTINDNFPHPPPLKNSITNASLTPTSQAFPNLNSNNNSSRIKLKRQKKDLPDKNDELDELLETGKKLFRESTSSNKRNEKHHLNFFDDYVEKELEANNATLISIPKGVQIKTAAKQGNKKINSVVNIVTSTQRIIVFDNNTEIENMLEMQMQKNIEDDKGANRGSEEVRIIETERVMPIVNKKLNGLALHIKKRSYNNRFLTQRRSRRSIKFSTGPPSSNFAFDKMARRLKKRNSFSNRQIASHFKVNGRRKIAIPDTPTRDEPIPDKTEIDDFVRLFLKQLRKYRKSQRKKNDTAWLKDLRNGEFRNDTKQHSTRKSKTVKKNFELIKQVNVVMNLDLTWNTIMKDSVKSRNSTLHQNYLMTNVETPTPTKISTHQIPQTLVYLGDRSDSGFKTILLFLIIALLFTLMVWFIREKMRRLSDLNSKSRSFYHQGKCDKFKGLKYTRIGDVCMDDYPQLEWQSENGNWLTETDTDFK